MGLCVKGKGITIYGGLGLSYVKKVCACPPSLSPVRHRLRLRRIPGGLRRVSDSPEFRCPHSGLRKSETGTRKAAKFRFLAVAKFLWEVLALEARYKVKWGGIASHGAVIKCLYPRVRMAGSHVEEGGLFINDRIYFNFAFCDWIKSETPHRRGIPI